MKTFRKLSAIFLSLALLAAVCVPLGVSAAEGDGSSGGTSSTPSGGTNNGGGDWDTDPVIDAKLYVKSSEKLSLSAGDITEFPMIVASRTGDYTEDVRITISGEQEYKNKFSLQDPTGWYKVDNLTDEQRIAPTINVSSDLPDGRYTLIVSFQYADAKGNYFTSNDSLTITIYGKSTDKPYLSAAKFQVAEIGKENKAKLDISVTNPTKYSLYDTKLTFDTAKNEKFSLYENFLPATIRSINPNETGKATFSIYLAQGVASGNYPLTFTMSYRDPNGGVYTSAETIYVEVKRSSEVEEDGKASKPRIIIQSYKTSVETIEAGKSFNLDFTLQNTSADTDVTNVKVVLGSEEASTNTATGGKTNNNVFFPSEGSNSFFIEKIAPKGSVSNSITLTTSQDVEPGVYSLTLGIEYDANGTAVSPSEEKLAFPVAQQQRLDIQGFSVEGNTMLGSSVPVTFQYINKGKATIYNFSVDVEGDFTLEDTTMSYIGNLTSGYNDTYENYLSPQKEGECAGAILFKYEDSQGVEKVEKKEFTVNVQSMDMPTGGDMGGMIGGGMVDPETGFPLDPESGLPLDPDTGLPIQKGGVLPIVLGCVAAVVVIGGAVTFVVLRKKKKAKELVEDEED